MNNKCRFEIDFFIQKNESLFETINKGISNMQPLPIITKENEESLRGLYFTGFWTFSEILEFLKMIRIPLRPSNSDTSHDVEIIDESIEIFMNSSDPDRIENARQEIWIQLVRYFNFNEPYERKELVTIKEPTGDEVIKVMNATWLCDLETPSFVVNEILPRMKAIHTE